MDRYYGSEDEHTDAEPPDDDPVDHTYSTDTEYAEQDRESQYGTIGDRGDGVDVERPPDDIEELLHQKHLEALFHKLNRDKWDDYPHPNDGEILFHLKVAKESEKYLGYQGIEPDDGEVPPFIYRLLLLMTVANYDITETNQLKQFREDYLTALDSRVLDEYGLEDPSAELSITSMFGKVGNLTEDELDRIENAGIQLSFGLYRRGIVPPDVVKDRFELDAVEPPLDEKQIRDSVKRAALRKWVKLLIDETLDPLTYGRKQETYDVVTRLGLLATSALEDCGVQKAAKSAAWHYDEENIPAGIHLHQNLIDFVPLNSRSFSDASKRDVLSIEDQFDRIHRNALNLARDLDIIDSPQLLAMDDTTVEWTGTDDAPTVERGAKPGTDSTEDWKFKILSIVGPEAPLTLGVRPIFDDSRAGIAASGLLDRIPEDFPIDLILADAGEASGDVFDAFSAVAGNKWLVSAPEDFPVKEVIWATPSNAVGYTDRIDWYRDEGVCIFAYPYNRFLTKDKDDEEANDGAEKDDGENDEEEEEEYGVHDEKIFIPSKLLNNRNNPLHKKNIKQQKLSSDYFDADSNQHPLEEHVLDVSEQDTLPKFVVGDTHATFYTGLDIGKRSPTPKRLKYHSRWGAEDVNNQLKNNLLPVSESGNPEPRLFMMNIAVMFRNWHSIINRAPAPESDLRLNVTYHDLLHAVQDVAFDRHQ